jgi:3D (Asp-Asp-Asp) domain-containing protein
MKINKIKQFRIIPLKLAKKLLIAFIFIFIFDFFLFPAPALASENNDLANISDENSIINNSLADNASESIFNNTLPENNELNTVKAGIYEITAYTSDINQCDGSPCITANGFNVCEHGIEDSIAANFLKFGTKVKIPELFGDKVFIVRDRMNPRYDQRVDIWMINKDEAIKFGLKYTRIEILAEP